MNRFLQEYDISNFNFETEKVGGARILKIWIFHSVFLQI